MQPLLLCLSIKRCQNKRTAAFFHKRKRPRIPGIKRACAAPDNPFRRQKRQEQRQYPARIPRIFYCHDSIPIGLKAPLSRACGAAISHQKQDDRGRSLPKAGMAQMIFANDYRQRLKAKRVDHATGKRSHRSPARTETNGGLPSNPDHVGFSRIARV